MSSAGASECRPCSRGMFRPAASLFGSHCLVCPAGSYSDVESSLECKSCTVGQHIDSVVEDSADRHVICKICASGMFNPHHEMNANLHHNCTLCPPGFFIVDHRREVRHHDEVDDCMRCKLGTYSNWGSNQCLVCPAGFIGAHDTHRNISLCRMCDSGFYSRKGSCVECPSGFAQKNSGKVFCTSCPPGRYNSKQAALSCESCEPGFKCVGGGKNGRIACEVGYYSSINQSVECFPCNPGKYARWNASAKCDDCPSGWLQENTGQPNCMKPAFGYISASGVASVAIARGWTPNNCSDDGTCKDSVACSAGTFEKNFSCLPCPRGWSSTPGMTLCEVCGRGKYSDEIGSICQNCPGGWFQDQSKEKSLKCSQCPHGYEALKNPDGSLVKGAALCRQLNWVLSCNNGQYLNDSIEDPGSRKCEDCPPGGSCQGDSVVWSKLGPLFGWWKIPVNERDGDAAWKSTIAFIECEFPPACRGAPNRDLQKRFYSPEKKDAALIGNNGTINVSVICAVDLGYRNKSRLCHACSNAYRRQGSQCIACPDPGTTWVLILLGTILLLLIVVLLVTSTIKDAGEKMISSSLQKILLDYLQVSALAQRFPLRWPTWVKNLFDLQSAVSTAGEALIIPECATEISGAALFYAKTTGFAVVPFVATVLSFLFWFTYGWLCGESFFAKRGVDKDNTDEGEGEGKMTLKDKFVVSIAMIMYLLYPTFCKATFEMFDCKKIGGTRYLAVDLEHPCYEREHLVAIFTLGLGQLVVFVFGLPLIVFLFLQRNLKRRGGLDRPVIRVRYGIFFTQYTEEYFYWECFVITGRKIAIVALSVFGKSMGVNRQAQVALFVLMVFLTLEIMCKPYCIVTARHETLHNAEIMGLGSCWITMWLGTLIFASQGPDNEGLVTFLSIAVALVNVGTTLWMGIRLVAEFTYEKKENMCFAPCLRRCTVCYQAKKKVEKGEGCISDAVSVAQAASHYNPLVKYKSNATALEPGTTLELGDVNDEHQFENQKGHWTREYDDTSGNYYLYNEVTGESKWEHETKPGNVKPRAEAETRYFHRYETEGGEAYFVPESDDEQSFWYLPEGGKVL